ncbi:hypothetical protein [Streptomyces sp. NBC_01614]|uniref:hypothetical protein n=1 Tax=Streptomyces sp. NBC_01614 TaxID=2975897 RepID=UPI0038676BB9
MTPVRDALVELGDHCVKCPTCKPEWHGDTPVHRPCPAADALYEQWRQRRREEVRAA